jgi:hypothetical protein
MPDATMKASQQGIQPAKMSAIKTRFAYFNAPKLQQNQRATAP